MENEIGNNKWMGYIQNEIESMNKLINELLLLAKIENIDNLKDYKPFNVSKETEIIISMFESMAREKIFERFYRIDKSRNRNEKRYGLGLAIAKATVSKYNGKIEVLYNNGYTIFKVTIPA